MNVKLQTTRIFAPWRSQVNPEEMIYWREIARPQIHGHDINCVAVIQGSGNHRFVSGADEKVSRVFEAPLSFLKTLQQATLSQPDISEDLDSVQVLGANMSALGLSQKPIYTHGKYLPCPPIYISLSHNASLFGLRNCVVPNSLFYSFI